MAVNFGLLQQAAPVSAFFQGQQDVQAEADRNALRQQQAQQLAMQQENALALREQRAAQAAELKAKTERAAQRQDFLTRLGAKMAEGGYKLDRPTLGQVLQFGMQTGEDSLIKLATEGIRALDEEDLYRSEATRFGLPGGPAPATPSAPTTTPAPANALVAPLATTPAGATGFTREQVQQMLTSPSARIREQGKSLAATLPKEDSTAAMREYEKAVAQGFKGTFLEYKQAIQPKPAQTTVVLPPQEKEERGARGKLLVEQYKGIAETARLAGRTLPALETQERILDSGFKTGFGTEAQKAAASVLSSLGVPEATQYATSAQTFLAATQQAVLQKQLEQKGTQTQNDAVRIEQTNAQLGNTSNANKFIVSVAKAQLKRDIEQRNFYDAWWKKNGTYDGAEDAWFSGEGGKSLFDRPELKQYAAPAKPAAAPAASPSGTQPYSDAEKERRYQEWKRKQQGTP